MLPLTLAVGGFYGTMDGLGSQQRPSIFLFGVFMFCFFFFSPPNMTEFGAAKCVERLTDVGGRWSNHLWISAMQLSKIAGGLFDAYNSIHKVRILKLKVTNPEHSITQKKKQKQHQQQIQTILDNNKIEPSPLFRQTVQRLS